MMTVLIVDDDEDMRVLARGVIELFHPELAVIAEVESGRDAIDVWRATKPDVVLLDYRLPDVSGLEVAKRMLADAPEQRVVLFTAYMDAALTKSAAGVGVCECVRKTDVLDVGRALERCAQLP